jgi:arginine:ornithine antiporter/lysine permease
MTTTDEPQRQATGPAAKLSMLTMTGMVVGSMVGAGVFSLPRQFAQETGVAVQPWLQRTGVLSVHLGIV